jgi:AcrR family transcriptional regulator
MSRPILKRQHIHEAAMKLFVEKGIEGTTTREIAEAAKAGEGTMFRHYKSKEDLAWHLFDENLTRFLVELEDDIQRQPTTRQKIRAMVEKCYALFETDRTMCSYLLLSEHTVGRRMPPNYKTPITVLVALVEQGQALGDIRPMDPQLAAALVFGAVLRVPIFKIYGRVQRDLREMVEEVTETCWKMVQL